jgi:peptidoglycan/LPS O-acetylase OafA/YrhL
MRPPDQRLIGIDALKGVACVLIVWHHLAFYGPMSDVIYPLAPSLTNWLYDYGRMAVHVFLVVSGFLAASSLAPGGVATFIQPVRLVFRRYLRLVPPYLVALAVTLVVSWWVRPWFDHASVPDAPTLLQLLAHGLLLQNILGFDALSAGVWYVAIDLQLFAMTVIFLGAARQLQRRWPAVTERLWGTGLLLLLALSSLLVFNRQARLDDTGLYFFGSYALGLLAFWASTAVNKVNTRGVGLWLMVMAVLGGAALVLDFRGRLALALLVAFGLVGLQQRAVPWGWLQQRWLIQLGQISYCTFLIHFPVCLLVNAVVSRFWPTQIAANALGLLAAFLLSLLSGATLYRAVEFRGTPRGRAREAGSVTL